MFDESLEEFARRLREVRIPRGHGGRAAGGGGGQVPTVPKVPESSDARPDWSNLHCEYSSLNAGTTLAGLSTLFPDMNASETTRLVVLDVETMGFTRGASSYVFLTGLGGFEGGHVEIDQVLLTSPGEEEAYLEQICARLVPGAVVLTFNGGTFDFPQLRSRYTLNKKVCPLDEVVHVDLKPLAQQVWRPRLKGWSISKLEKRVLGTVRANDIKGGDIPDIYTSFLKSGDRGVLNPVLEHNARDLFSTASLATLLGAAALDPGSLVDPLDVFGLGMGAVLRGPLTQSWNEEKREMQRILFFALLSCLFLGCDHNTFLGVQPIDSTGSWFPDVEARCQSTDCYFVNRPQNSSA